MAHYRACNTYHTALQATLLTVLQFTLLYMYKFWIKTASGIAVVLNSEGFAILTVYNPMLKLHCQGTNRTAVKFAMQAQLLAGQAL